jgi:hypothetical protein
MVRPQCLSMLGPPVQVASRKFPPVSPWCAQNRVHPLRCLSIWAQPWPTCACPFSDPEWNPHVGSRGLEPSSEPSSEPPPAPLGRTSTDRNACPPHTSAHIPPRLSRSGLTMPVHRTLRLTSCLSRSDQIRPSRSDLPRSDLGARPHQTSWFALELTEIQTPPYAVQYVPVDMPADRASRVSSSTLSRRRASRNP